MPNREHARRLMLILLANDADMPIQRTPVVGAVHPVAERIAPDAVESGSFVVPSKTVRFGE